MKFFLLNFLLFVTSCPELFAQEVTDRAQFPIFLANSYISINPGYIYYPFNETHLESGTTVGEIVIPHAAARVSLGHEFNPYLSAQLSVMRPVKWAAFKDLDGNGNGSRTAWVNIWSVTLKPEYPINEKWSVNGEIGISNFSRRGFAYGGATFIKSTSYLKPIFGAGLQRVLNKNWDINLNVIYSPAKASVKQPYTIFIAPGIKYNLRPFSDDRVAQKIAAGYYFPKQLLQIGIANDFVGYNPNNWFVWTATNKKGIPIFWKGEVLTSKGFTFNYQKNIFHSRKSFSFDWGTSFSYWKSQEEDTIIIALSVFPVLRFWLLRRQKLDVYFTYSPAGPTYLTPVIIDGHNTGNHFTFQDFLGFGSFFGKDKQLNVELKITHYSNGGIFSSNPGVDVPVMLNLGYAF